MQVPSSSLLTWQPVLPHSNASSCLAAPEAALMAAMKAGVSSAQTQVGGGSWGWVGRQQGKLLERGSQAIAAPGLSRNRTCLAVADGAKVAPAETDGEQGDGAARGCRGAGRRVGGRGEGTA